MRNVLVTLVIAFAVLMVSPLAIYADDSVNETTPTQNEKTNISANEVVSVDVSDGEKYHEDMEAQKRTEDKKRKHEVNSKKYASKKAETKKEVIVEDTWESLGDCRITCYCPSCNDPAGSYQSSSGTTLYEGCVACSWLPIGTVLKINGTEYTVVDTCGTEAIDVFKDTSYCCCNENYYTEVFIKQ